MTNHREPGAEPPGSGSQRGPIGADSRRDLFAGVKSASQRTSASGGHALLKTPAPAPKEREKPALQHYEILSEIPDVRGGRAFRAKSKGEGRECVVKVLEKEAAKDDALVERFTREALALRRLAHPNIVQIRAASREAGMLYYVTEFVTETTLADLLKKGPLDLRKALSIGIQIAHALALVHEASVVHRDVSPGSIVVTEQGLAKLFNFAFVKNLADERQRMVTAMSDIVGDIAYCSPEQATDPRNATPAGDLYSLGATLFHAIAGRTPFQTQNPLEQLRVVISQDPPKLSALMPLCPAEVAEPIDRMIARDPGKRLGTAEEVAQVLTQALAAVSRAAEREEEQRRVQQAALSATSRIAQNLGGEFAGVELCEIVQFLEFTKKSGVMSVEGAQAKGEIYLRDGLIVGAKAGAEVNEAAATLLLLNPAGTFGFRVAAAGEKPPSEAVKVKPSAIAMEVMRRLDETGKK